MRSSTLARHTAYDLNTIMARVSILLIFFIYGARMATWHIYVPYLQTRFNITEFVIGMLFLVMSVGATVGVLVSSPIIARLGSRFVAIISTLVQLVFTTLIILTPSLPVFVVGSLIYGFTAGTTDIAMNMQGVAFQHKLRRPVMSAFHGAYSVGMLSGGGLGALAIGLGLGVGVHVWAVMLVLLMLTFFAALWLLPPSQEPERTQSGATFSFPRGILLVLGLMAFGAYLAEEIVASWGGLYMQNSLLASEEVVPLAYLSFALMMTVGRALGDWLTHRFNIATVIRLSGLTAALGLGVGLLFQHPLAALVGFGFTGFGVANIAPLIIAAAGQTQGHKASAAVSAVSTVGYTAYLVGPPLVGAVAQQFSLDMAMGITVVLCVAVALGARFTR